MKEENRQEEETSGEESQRVNEDTSEVSTNNTDDSCKPRDEVTESSVIEEDTNERRAEERSHEEEEDSSHDDEQEADEDDEEQGEEDNGDDEEETGVQDADDNHSSSSSDSDNEDEVEYELIQSGQGDAEITIDNEHLRNGTAIVVDDDEDVEGNDDVEQDAEREREITLSDSNSSSSSSSASSEDEYDALSSDVDTSSSSDSSSSSESLSSASSSDSDEPMSVDDDDEQNDVEMMYSHDSASQQLEDESLPDIERMEIEDNSPTSAATVRLKEQQSDTEMISVEIEPSQTACNNSTHPAERYGNPVMRKRAELQRIVDSRETKPSRSSMTHFRQPWHINVNGTASTIGIVARSHVRLVDELKKNTTLNSRTITGINRVERRPEGVRSAYIGSIEHSSVLEVSKSERLQVKKSQFLFSLQKKTEVNAIGDTPTTDETKKEQRINNVPQILKANKNTKSNK